MDALERLWPSVVETRGDPPAYLGVQSLAWADVGAGCGYVWALVVGSLGRRSWTHNVDRAGHNVDAVRGEGWAGVVDTRGLASWICVETCCGRQWTWVVG